MNIQTVKYTTKKLNEDISKMTKDIEKLEKSIKDHDLELNIKNFKLKIIKEELDKLLTIKKFV